MPDRNIEKEDDELSESDIASSVSFEMDNSFKPIGDIDPERNPNRESSQAIVSINMFPSYVHSEHGTGERKPPDVRQDAYKYCKAHLFGHIFANVSSLSLHTKAYLFSVPTYAKIISLVEIHKSDAQYVKQ